MTTLLYKHDVQLAYLGKLLTCPHSGLINISDPQLYAAKSCGLHTDNPTFQQALNSPAAAEYLAAMKLEIHTSCPTMCLGFRLSTTYQFINVLRGTWVFKKTLA
jgi:hypothetical protein